MTIETERPESNASVVSANVVPRADAQGPPAARCYEIDGIRGWAALSVLLFHLLWEIFGVVRPGYRSPDLFPLIDGHLALYVFFVLSGDALSLSFTDSRRDTLSARVVLKRYFRLAGPVLFACAITYLLMRLGLNFNSAAGDIVQRSDWLGAFLQFEPSFAKMLRYGLISVFTDGVGPTSYNPFLWTMSIELAGSLLVFCLFPIKRCLRNELFALSVATLYLWLLGSLFALFLAGVVFGMLRDRGVFDALRRNVELNRAASVAGVVAIYLLDKYSTRWGLPASVMKIALASSIVFVCYASRDLLTFVRAKISRGLGRISFSLYLMQFPVIVSFTSWCIVQGAAHPDSLIASPPIIVLASLVVTMVVAMLTTALEARYLRVVDFVLDRFVLKPASAARKKERA